MGTTNRGLPFPEPTARPDVPADIEALAVSADDLMGALRHLGQLNQGATLESTGAWSAWGALGAGVPVIAGRLYAIDLWGLIDDRGTTTVGTGATVEVQTGGAAVAGSVEVARQWISNNNTANACSWSARRVVTATQDGTLTVSLRILRTSGSGRPTLWNSRGLVSCVAL